MKNFWENKKVLVTGGGGFLGGYVVKKLLERHVPRKNIFIPRSKYYDLRFRENCKKVVKGKDILIHLAANVGGIGYNRDFPGTLFYDNILIGTHIIEEARKAAVKKFVSVGTICSYPKYAPIPFKEEDLWNGYPEETNAPYGLAKKMQIVQGQSYQHQYGFNSIYLMQVNLYGPRDNFDPKSSHVIPALIRKFVEAKRKHLPQVTVWGTGKPTREFLYVEDAAEGILMATEKYNKPDPVNLGSSFEISIKNLAKLISKQVGYKGKIIFDITKPDGQPRRKLDVSKAKKEFGFKAKTDFDEGLLRTITWYKNEYRR